MSWLGGKRLQVQESALCDYDIADQLTTGERFRVEVVGMRGFEPPTPCSQI